MLRFSLKVNVFCIILFSFLFCLIIHFEKTEFSKATITNTNQKTYQIKFPYTSKEDVQPGEYTFNFTIANNFLISNSISLTADDCIDYIKINEFLLPISRNIFSKCDATHATLNTQHHNYMAANIDVIKQGVKVFSSQYNAQHSAFSDLYFSALVYEGVSGTTYYQNQVIRDATSNLRTTTWLGSTVTLQSLFPNLKNIITSDSAINCPN